MAKKIVIVGGVAGGATTAARLRRLMEFAEIILLEKDGYISFANCGLPYYIGGSIAERSELILQSPESFHARFQVDVRTFSRVSAVDTANKTVHVVSAAQGEYDETYDTLVLCPGASPIQVPTLEDAAHRVFTLRNVDDIDRIFQAVTEEDTARAVVVGGGFVGLEIAENLVERGIAVRLVEAAPHILPPFDEDMTLIAQHELECNCVKLVLGIGVNLVEKSKDGVHVVLSDGDIIETDIVISAVGVRPATAFLDGSGIALGPKGHILVDKHMRTNIPDVYAAGDAIQVTDFVTKQPTAVPLAGPANKQARIAADNIAGIPHTYGGTQGTAILKLFGLTAACTGANERTLRRENIPYLKAVLHPFSHATYYPGARQLTAKLLFSPQGEILGLQMVGGDGVDKRVDVVATAMRLGAHVTQLTELELAYAPPYSSAKDPVNMLGYVAQNMLEGVTDMVDYTVLATLDAKSSILLDVRTQEEYARGHLEGAVNIPVDSLRERMQELDKNKEIIEYCQVGVRAHTAHRILKQHGFKVKSIAGGYRTAGR